MADKDLHGFVRLRFLPGKSFVERQGFTAFPSSPGLPLLTSLPQFSQSDPRKTALFAKKNDIPQKGKIPGEGKNSPHDKGTHAFLLKRNSRFPVLKKGSFLPYSCLNPCPLGACIFREYIREGKTRGREKKGVSLLLGDMLKIVSGGHAVKAWVNSGVPFGLCALAFSLQTKGLPRVPSQ